MADFSSSPPDSSDPRFHERLVEQSSDVTMVVDSANRIRYASAAAGEMLGDDPKGVVGDELTSYVHGADREAFGDALSAVREHPTRSRTVEARFEATDGALCWMEAVLQDQTGDEVIDGVLVTARARGERDTSPQTTKERLELALKGANIGIWDWDMERDRMERDELLTEMLGYTPDEMGGHIEDWERLVHPEGETRHDQALGDNGPGIPDERKAHIFEEGEQGIDSEGTGLGLYLVETLLDRYGGAISVADNEPAGTVFTVQLPLAG